MQEIHCVKSSGFKIVEGGQLPHFSVEGLK